MSATYETRPADLGRSQVARIEVLMEPDLFAHRRAYRPAESTGPLPYGLHGLEQFGIQLTQHRRAVPESLGRLERLVEHRTGMEWAAPLGAATSIRGSDAILSVFENYGYFASRARALRLPPYSRVPLAVVCCWVAEVATKASKSELKRLRRLLTGIDLLVYISANQRQIFTELLHVPEERQLNVGFGVDTVFYSPTDVERDLDVVSVGQDLGRDFESLVTAARGRDFSVTIVTSAQLSAPLMPLENVVLPGKVDHRKYRELLRRAKVVMIPTRELAYPTGRSVALEAMACGCAVIVTDTPAMKDYIRPGIDALLTPVGDPQAIRIAIENLLGDDAERVRLGTMARQATLDRFKDTEVWKHIWSTGASRGLW